MRPGTGTVWVSQVLFERGRRQVVQLERAQSGSRQEDLPLQPHHQPGKAWFWRIHQWLQRKSARCLRATRTEVWLQDILRRNRSLIVSQYRLTHQQHCKWLQGEGLGVVLWVVMWWVLLKDMGFNIFYIILDMRNKVLVLLVVVLCIWLTLQGRPGKSKQ